MNSFQISHRAIRSYVLRQGRITGAQHRALDNYWGRYGIAYSRKPLDLDRQFGRSAPRILEIGAGAGEVTLASAARHPENDYLVIEVHRPGIGRLMQQAHARKLNNIRIINHDAVEVLTHQLPGHCLDQAWIFFPDPWPKRRHHKRRLVNTDFISLLATRLQAHARLFIATDWEHMAEQIMLICDNSPQLINLAGKGNFAPRPGWRPVTKFERRGRDLGHKIRDLVYGTRVC